MSTKRSRKVRTHTAHSSMWVDVRMCVVRVWSGVTYGDFQFLLDREHEGFTATGWEKVSGGGRGRHTTHSKHVRGCITMRQVLERDGITVGRCKPEESGLLQVLRGRRGERACMRDRVCLCVWLGQGVRHFGVDRHRHGLHTHIRHQHTGHLGPCSHRTSRTPTHVHTTHTWTCLPVCVSLFVGKEWRLISTIDSPTRHKASMTPTEVIYSVMHGPLGAFPLTTTHTHTHRQT